MTAVTVILLKVKFHIRANLFIIAKGGQASEVSKNKKDYTQNVNLLYFIQMKEKEND